MHPLTAAVLSTVTAIVAVALAMMDILFRTGVLLWIGVALAVATIVLEIGFVRCPHCKKQLSLHFWDVLHERELHCKYCGKKIED